MNNGLYIRLGNESLVSFSAATGPHLALSLSAPVRTGNKYTNGW
jgi:hypothetical protein